MKKGLILLILYFIFALGQTIQTEYPIPQNLQVKDTLAITKPQPINPEMIGLAGENLRTCRTMFYSGFSLSLGGSILTSVGIISKDPGKGLLYVGSVITLSGLIVELVSFNKIGSAGDLFKKAIGK